MENYTITVQRRDTANGGEAWCLAVDDEPVSGPGGGGVGVFNSSVTPWTPAEALRRLLIRHTS